MDKKLNVAVIFGGKSGEHEVSLMSATNVIKAMDRAKYNIHMIGITKSGRWMAYKGDVEKIQDGSWEKEACEGKREDTVELLFSGFFKGDKASSIDVVFPVLHGPNGEDGTVQGLFELLDIPYVGCGVTASALGMDKAFSKLIFKSHGIPVGAYNVFMKQYIQRDIDIVMNGIEEEFDYPVFVKPANMGSSVGISKAHDRAELSQALLEAIKHDRKVLVEASIKGREIECAVLGNDNPIASGVGEIIPSHEFYDYVAKYFDGDNSKIIIPADIDREKQEEIKEYAVKAYKALDCEGMARVDFFIDEADGSVYLNELNTIPGFTRISMYPKLWDHAGMSYSKLIDMLIELSIESYNNKH